MRGGERLPYVKRRFNEDAIDIPKTVPLPKWLTRDDLRLICRTKQASPDRTWSSIIREVGMLKIAEPALKGA